MVSIMSSMNRCTAGVRILSGSTGVACIRRTGWPRRATFRIAITGGIVTCASLRLDAPDLAHALREAPRVGLEELLELLTLLEGDGRLDLVHGRLELRLV